ncbi:MAG: hypothetical protein ACOX5J_15695 [Candidatus Hydrogenedentales bacterium]
MLNRSSEVTENAPFYDGHRRLFARKLFRQPLQGHGIRQGETRLKLRM